MTAATRKKGLSRVTDDELDKAFLALTASGELDRIFRQLRSAWDGSLSREVVLEALGDAMAEVVRRHQDGLHISNLPGLLQTVSRRRLSKIWFCQLHLAPG